MSEIEHLRKHTGHLYTFLSMTLSISFSEFSRNNLILTDLQELKKKLRILYSPLQSIFLIFIFFTVQMVLNFLWFVYSVMASGFYTFFWEVSPICFLSFFSNLYLNAWWALLKCLLSFKHIYFIYISVFPGLNFILLIYLLFLCQNLLFYDSCLMCSHI